MDTQGKAVIFSAPSGAGKTTIVKALLQRGLPLAFSVSACSRNPRGGELHGKDYYFIGISGFKQAIERDELLEWEEVYPDQFYGTLKSETARIWNSGKAIVFDVDAYGGIALKKLLGANAFSIFVKPPSAVVLEQRLRARATESEEKIAVRMKKAAEEIALHREFDLTVVNDDLQQTIAQTEAVIKQFLAK